MQAILPYLYAFLVGGAFCLIGQVLIDRTKLTPARILSGYVVAGVLLGALGWYQPLIDFAGAGATVPLTGFGSLLARGVKKAVAEQGLLGALVGGLQKGRRSRPPQAGAASAACGFRRSRNAPPPDPESCWEKRREGAGRWVEAGDERLEESWRRAGPQGRWPSVEAR